MIDPATSLARSIQQLRSFGELHSSELDGLAAELEAAGLPELARRVRAFRELHRQESGLVLDELSRLHAQLASAEPAAPDPSASPKHAAWLAEQAQPRPRRELFRRS